MQDATSGPIPFGRYQLIQRIGAGGMGEVFLARDDAAVPPRACVVKKVLPSLAQNRAFVGRFLDESKVVVNLQHPNIARVYAMGEVEGHYYLAMEYVQGKTVSRYMHRLRQRREEMSLGLILLIGERMCEGLAYAHDATDSHGNPLHLVHRDLSPANVCVSYRGEVKIIDFGAAQSTLKEEQTAPRVVIGNLAYMAPEQARKQFVDRRADVYSAGAVLWELLAWKPLPQKGDPIERWRRAANPNWDPPSRHRPHVPAEVDAAVLKALSREAKDRFQNAAELGAELLRLRTRYAPDVKEPALGEILSSIFSEEKAAEDASLEEIAGIGISNAPTDPARSGPRPARRDSGKTRVFVPPTALAFEHAALSAPADYVPSDERVTEPGLVPDPQPTLPRRETVNMARVGFGVSFSDAEKQLEPAWVREIEGVVSGELDYDTAAIAAPPGAALPGWLLYSAAFLGALGTGFLAVWLLAR